MGQIGRIKEKLELLQREDKYLYVTGAENHHYELNPCLSEAAVCDFERQYQVRLPDGYRAFLLEVGNGGAGPRLSHWELFSLEKAADLTFDLELLCKPFPLTQRLTPADPICELYGLEKLKFNIATMMDDFNNYWDIIEEFDPIDPRFQQVWREVVDKFAEPSLCHGVLWIGGDMCLLVVTGDERGKIWLDTSGYDDGIYPFTYAENPTEHMDFLDWYEHWLDTNVQELAEHREQYSRPRLVKPRTKYRESLSIEWTDDDIPF